MNRQKKSERRSIGKKNDRKCNFNGDIDMDGYTARHRQRERKCRKNERHKHRRRTLIFYFIISKKKFFSSF